jgi:hypothetical protein
MVFERNHKHNQDARVERERTIKQEFFEFMDEEYEL